MMLNLPHVADLDTSSGFRHILIGIVLANSTMILSIAWKLSKSAVKARKFIHRQNWRINILWQERLEAKGWAEDPVEKELFGEHFD